MTAFFILPLRVWDITPLARLETPHMADEVRQ